MKRFFICAIYILSCITAFAQHFDTSKYVRIGKFVIAKNNPDILYLRTDGDSIIDIRKATPQQLERIKKYERIQTIYTDSSLKFSAKMSNEKWYFIREDKFKKALTNYLRKCLIFSVRANTKF